MPLSFTRDPWSASSALLLLVTLLTVGAVAWHRRCVLLELHPWQWLAASAPLALLTVLSVRHLPIFALWISPVLVLLSGAMFSIPSGWLRHFWTALSGALIVPAFLTLTIVYHDPSASIGVPEETLGRTEPFGAVEFIKRNGLAGNALPPSLVGQLRHMGAVSADTSRDGRSQRVPVPNGDGQRQPGVLHTRRWRFESAPSVCLRLPPGAVRRSGAGRLAVDGRWRKIFEDPDCVLFVQGRLAERAHSPRTRPRTQLCEPRSGGPGC